MTGMIIMDIISRFRSFRKYKDTLTKDSKRNIMLFFVFVQFNHSTEVKTYFLFDLILQLQKTFISKHIFHSIWNTIS